MTAVEDIRDLISRHNVYHLEEPDYMLNNDQLVDKLSTLFSTLLDGLVMEEREYIPWNASLGISFTTSKDIAKNCANQGFNEAVREFNQRLQSMKLSLGETK